MLFWSAASTALSQVSDDDIRLLNKLYKVNTSHADKLQQSEIDQANIKYCISY